MSGTIDENRGLVSQMRGMMAWLLGGTIAGTTRNTWQDFGYPTQISVEQMTLRYRRGGIASRIVRAFPQATWREQPKIRDEAGDSWEQGSASYSPFVEAVSDLFDRMRVLHYMERADRLSSIGQFGVLFLGFRNGQPGEPLGEGSNPLIYLAPYGEPDVQVASWDQDVNSPRFGLPLTYTLKSGGSSLLGGSAAQRRSLTVHHSRVIHVSETLESDDVFGVPTLEPVWNHLLDLEKVLGSGAESFYLNSRGGLALSADKDAKLDQGAVDDMRAQVEDFQNNLRRALALRGTTAQMLQATIADPKGTVDSIVDQIAGTKGIPKRILIGSERGELGGDNDEMNWGRRIDERQENFATPVMVRPFIDRMIVTGNIPAPQGSYWVEWPQSTTLSPERQAEIGLKRAQALVAFANAPAAELIVPTQEFRTDFLGMEPESEYSVPDDMDDLDETDDQVTDQLTEQRRLTVNISPRTLYVHRPVLNGEEIREHFRAQGITTMLPADQMHITLAYSRTPVDWSKIEPVWNQDDAGELVVAPGGMRAMELFGRDVPRRFLVLVLSDSRLGWRHESFRMGGCSWDHDQYEPHVSITTDVSQSWGDDPSGWNGLMAELVPYRGPIRLGPEVWEEVSEGWSTTIRENAGS